MPRKNSNARSSRPGERQRPGIVWTKTPNLDPRAVPMDPDDCQPVRIQDDDHSQLYSEHVRGLGFGGGRDDARGPHFERDDDTPGSGHGTGSQPGGRR